MIRLRIKERDQFAVDFDGKTLPVYLEVEPDPKPEGYISIMICPECSDGLLVKGGTGPDSAIPYRCNNIQCDVKWLRKTRMEPDVILEMGGFYT